MNDDPDPRPEQDRTLVIDIAIPCAEWRGVPKIEALCWSAVTAAIAGTGVELGPAEISLVLSDDEEVRELNRRWRSKDAPTNVLSFPGGASPPAREAPALLGDVVLAFATVAREAREQRKPMTDHLRHLIVHGVLHLLGFDHEERQKAERMERLEIKILRGLGVPDPYAAIELEHE